MTSLGQRVLRQELTAFKTLGSAVLAALETPQPSSPRSADLAWMAGRSPVDRRERLQAVASGALVDVAGVMLSAEEHIRALDIVFSAEVPLPLPGLTLARAVQEAAILCCYLTDPAVPPAARMARVAALRMHTALENQKTVRLFGATAGVERRGRAAEAVEGLKAYYAKAGLDLGYDRRNRYVTSIVCEGEQAPLIPKITELSAHYIPLAHTSWVIGSGATHSRTWLTEGLEGPRALLDAAVVLPLLDVADALVDTMCGFVGHDNDAWRRRTHTRRIALNHRLGNVDPAVSWTDYGSPAGENASP